MQSIYKTLLLGIASLLVACAQETVVHNLEEREANKIIEVLSQHNISGSKSILDNGRTVVYQISVPARARLEAIALLNHHELPRRRDIGYAETFSGGSLIPTSGEEKAKQLAALEGEVQKQLKLVDNILDVQVRIVQPEENALRTAQDIRSPTTASITLKYLPGLNGAKPLSEAQVQTLVAAGVERLTPENVVVVMTPGGTLAQEDKPTAANRADADTYNDISAPKGLHNLTEKTLRLATIVLVALILAMSLGLAVTQLRLRTVRNRLIRLQNEIAKARQRVSDIGPPGV